MSYMNNIYEKTHVTTTGHLWSIVRLDNDGLEHYGISYDKNQAIEDANSNIEYGSTEFPSWLLKMGELNKPISEQGYVVHGIHGLLKKHLPLSILTLYDVFVTSNKHDIGVVAIPKDSGFPSIVVQGKDIKTCLYRVIVEYEKAHDTEDQTNKTDQLNKWFLRYIWKLPRIKLHDLS